MPLILFIHVQLQLSPASPSPLAEDVFVHNDLRKGGPAMLQENAQQAENKSVGTQQQKKDTQENEVNGTKPQLKVVLYMHSYV